MSKRLPKIYLKFLVSILILSIQACVISNKVPVTGIPRSLATQSSPVDSPTQSISTSGIPLSLVPSLLPIISSAVLSPTPSSVTITAVKGNLFIRRGPDMAYNPIALLLNGQSAPVLGHDVLRNWVEVPIAALPGKTGWISIQTVYSSLSGDPMDTPEIVPASWPVAAYIRNCMYDKMIVEPGDTVLESLLNAPDNEMWIYPGLHKVYDTDVDGQPEVFSVDLREGMTVDVRIDGNGDHHKCP